MAEIKDSKLIRDALGSPVPQYWDETSQMYIARTVDGSFADVDFSKVRLLRDKLGSVIPQLWDTETARFVPGKGGGNGEVTIGSVQGLQEELDATATQLAENVTKTNDNTSKVLNILPLYKNKVHPNLQHLFNPFVKSQIKLLGDSITAGSGGTGYSATGETIFGNYKANLPTAKCWANDIAKFINDNFNKVYDVPVDNSGITVIGTKTDVENWGVFGKAFQFTNYSADTNGVQLSFYGTEITIVHTQQPNNGIMNVYIDEVLHSQLEGYSASYKDNEVKISGLSEGNHVVKIMDSNTKNASATNKLFVLQGFRIPKKTVCKNWGIAGVNSKFIYDNLNSLSPSGDTTVILQIGTNDRGAFKSPQYTIYNYKRIQTALASAGKNLIIMVANATTDEPGTMNFKMVDLDTAIQKYCIDNNVEYVSNYKFFMKYTNKYNVSLSPLLDGIGLHPNDRGYELMYLNVHHSLGF